MNIIKIGDIKIFAGTPGPASTLLLFLLSQAKVKSTPSPRSKTGV